MRMTVFRKIKMTTEDFKKRSVLVYDNGLFVSLAERLVREFGSVGYFCPWESSFPDARELVIGHGLEGIERIKYFWKEVGKYDLIVFPDVWFGDLQERLRGLGFRVWGSGMGSELELARWKTKQRFPELGLDVNPATQVVGTKALRSFLAEHPKQYVKISALRGLGETWFSESLEMSEGQILEFESKHGEMAHLIAFICEDMIPDAREVGYDGFCIDGEFPEVALFGVEKKDKSYFGAVCSYDDLPQSVLDVNNALWKPLDEFKYRQFFSTEIREKDGKNFVIDLTCRHASPAGEVYCELFDNLAEILWFGAEGKLITPVTSAKYGAQIIITSEWAEEHWQPISFPEELRGNVKLYNHCRNRGLDWAVPQIAKMKQVGSVVAAGDTPEEAKEAVTMIAEQVTGFDLETEAESLDGAIEEMEEILSESTSQPSK